MLFPARSQSIKTREESGVAQGEVKDPRPEPEIKETGRSIRAATIAGDMESRRDDQ